jgi:hypothetical protein
MLILLDNAATDPGDAAAPGAPGCLLVTSRRRLAGQDYTRTLSLGTFAGSSKTLPVPDSVTRFTHNVGDDPVAD